MSDIPRAQTSRVATERVFEPEGRGILHIDENELPADFRLKWVREYVLGRHDPDNVTRELDKGWDPVPAEAMPKLVPRSLDEGRPASKYIRRGGEILMRKPIKIAKEEEAAMREYNRRILQEVDRDRADASHPHMPAMRPELERRIERNNSRRFDDA